MSGATEFQTRLAEVVVSLLTALVSLLPQSGAFIFIHFSDTFGPLGPRRPNGATSRDLARDFARLRATSRATSRAFARLRATSRELVRLRVTSRDLARARPANFKPAIP